MQYRLTAALVAGAALMFGGCGDDNGTQPQQNALLRVVHAASGLGAADVTVGTLQGPTNLSFRGSSAQCVSVPPGQHTITVRAAGTANTLATVTQTFQPNQRYTLVFSGTGQQGQAAVVTDTWTAPGAGQQALRFFNATQTAGDVHVTSPGGVLGTASHGALAAGTGTQGFTNYPVANRQTRLFNTGTTAAARADFPCRS